MLLSEQERRRLRRKVLLEQMTPEQQSEFRRRDAERTKRNWQKRNPDRVARMRGMEGKAKCLICLYRCGFGKNRIARILNTSEEFVRLRTRRLSKTIERTFIYHRKGKRPRTYRGPIRAMKLRVRKCLNKSPVAGMSPADSFRWRYRNDPGFRLMQLCRRRARKLLAGVKTAGVHTRLVGCSSDHLRLHIQQQFKHGMNWNNYGKWHLDHIIPCSAFDLTREDQQRICFHWTNLRPLWARENLQKSSKLEKHETPQFAL